MKNTLVTRQIYIPKELWDKFRAIGILEGKDVTSEYAALALLNQLKQDAPKHGVSVNLSL